jgi:transcriptional regulator with XRE-family HTH domain
MGGEIVALNYKHIGRRIRQERLRKRLSQEKLAEMTDSSPQYISHIENARKRASLEMIVRIAKALDISVDQILSENLSVTQYKCDAELSRLVSGCSNFERRVILDVALATRYSLKENKWMVHTDKS